MTWFEFVPEWKARMDAADEATRVERFKKQGEDCERAIKLNPLLADVLKPAPAPAPEPEPEPEPDPAPEDCPGCKCEVDDERAECLTRQACKVWESIPARVAAWQSTLSKEDAGNVQAFLEAERPFPMAIPGGKAGRPGTMLRDAFIAGTVDAIHKWFGVPLEGPEDCAAIVAKEFRIKRKTVRNDILPKRFIPPKNPD